MGEGTDKPAGNGKRPIINIKLDKGFLTALLALLGVGGVGYGQFVQPGSAEREVARTGTDLQINDAYQKSIGQIRKLAKLARDRRAEIDQLYEVNEWLAASLAEMGKSHPAALRKIKRKAPEYLKDGFGFNDDVSPFAILSARRPASAEPFDEVKDEEELLDDIEAMPEEIAFPAADRIQAIVERRK